jgi:nitrite reductase/ring-hydroxylating ferredoxin subunit
MMMALLQKFWICFTLFCCTIAVVVLPVNNVNGFSVVFMARKGRGNLKQKINDDGASSSASGGALQKMSSLNRGKGQEITGVTLPSEGKIRGWEFGQGLRMACANVNGNFYAIQGQCPRCGFDLYKGDLIVNDAAFQDLPRLACPTCSTTYGLKSGKVGPSLTRKGLAGFVGGLAKTATVNDSNKNAKTFMITRDEDGRVYCRDKSG